MIKGPYFGDARNLALTSERLLKIFQADHRTHTDDDKSEFNSPETVGTTDKVRGGLSHEGKVALITAIKASYDRIGLDTQ